MDSALRRRLSPAQLQELVDYSHARLIELRGTRDYFFQDKMFRYERMSEADYRFRRTALQAPEELKSIYDVNNHALQLVRSVIRFLKARTTKDIFGSSPCFAAQPEGPHDTALAGQIQKHSDWKLRSADWEIKMREAVSVTMDLGTCAVKTTWRVDVDNSERLAFVLCGPDGEPIVGPDGDYIYQEDNIMTIDADGHPVPSSALEDSAAQPPEDDGSGEPAAPSLSDVAQTSQQTWQVYGKPMPDGSMSSTGAEPPSESNGNFFQEYLIEQRDRTYSGLDVSDCYWRDIVYPLNCREVSLKCRDCDFVGHTYDMTLEQLRAAYDPDGDNAEVQQVLQECLGFSSDPKSYAALPKRPDREPTVTRQDPNGSNPTIKVTECYFRKRVLPTGGESRIFMVLIEDIQRAIYVEYLSAISPMAECPIHLICINKCAQRAYGRGWYEIFEPMADLLDRLFNHILNRNDYHANPALFLQRCHIKGLDDNDKPMTIGPGVTYEITKPGLSPKDVYSVVEIPDLDERTWKLLELGMQLIQQESGVTNANQGDVAALPDKGTATGTNAILESGSVLHQYVLWELKSGMEPSLRYGIQLIYFRQDTDETYEYLDGQAQGVLTLANAQTLAKLPMKVKILLTRAHGQEMRDSVLAAIPQLDAYYAKPVQTQIYERPMMVEFIKAMGFDDADRFLPSMNDLKGRQQDEQNAPAAPPPENIGESVKWTADDFTPEQKQELIVKWFGITAATPEQMQQQVAAAAQAHAATKPKANEPAHPLHEPAPPKGPHTTPDAGELANAEEAPGGGPVPDRLQVQPDEGPYNADEEALPANVTP